MRMCVRGSLQRSVHDAAMELIFCRREQERRIDVLVPEAWMAAEQLSRSVVGMGLADRRPVAGVTEDFAASFGRMAVDADRRHAAPPAAMAHVQDRRPALEHVAAARPPPSGACMKEIRCSLTPSKPLQDSYRGMCREGRRTRSRLLAPYAYACSRAREHGRARAHAQVCTCACAHARAGSHEGARACTRARA